MFIPEATTTARRPLASLVSVDESPSNPLARAKDDEVWHSGTATAILGRAPPVVASSVTRSRTRQFVGRPAAKKTQFSSYDVKTFKADRARGRPPANLSAARISPATHAEIPDHDLPAISQQSIAGSAAASLPSGRSLAGRQEPAGLGVT